MFILYTLNLYKIEVFKFIGSLKSTSPANRTEDYLEDEVYTPNDELSDNDFPETFTTGVISSLTTLDSVTVSSVNFINQETYFDYASANLCPQTLAISPSIGDLPAIIDSGTFTSNVAECKSD